MRSGWLRALIWLSLLVLILTAAGGPSPIQAAVTCVNATLTGTYTQDFDSLANSGTTNDPLPAGWCLIETGGGLRDNEQYAADTGASNTGDTYSYGAAASTERAFGGLQSGTLIPVIGAAFTNGLTCDITQLQITYTGEQWRLGTTARTDQLTFQYSTNATSLDTGIWAGVMTLNFVSPDTGTPGVKNGNGSGNRTTLTSTIGSLSIPVGATFWIRWQDVNASGADDGLAVDDFTMVPSCGQPIVPTCPSPLTVTVGIGGSMLLSATDADSIVNGATITSAPVTGISLGTVTPAAADGGTLTVPLEASAAAALGSTVVTVQFSNDDGQAIPCNVTVNVNSPSQPIVPTCPTPLNVSQNVGGSVILSASDTDSIVNSAIITSAAVTGISLGTVTPAVADGGTLTVPLNVAGTTAVGGYPVTIEFGNDDSQTIPCTVTVNVAPQTRIREIQQSTHVSTLDGAAVSNVPGIVTARDTNGFYMQDPSPDASDATSEGIFVFTSSAPTVAVGDSVLVSGTGDEFVPGGSPTNLSTTQITSPTVVILSNGNPLPAPIVIGTGGRIPPSSVIEDDNFSSFDPASDGIDFYESLEGMRVQINNPVSVSPTNSFGELWVVGDNGANATGMNARGGITITATDFNPERIQLDDDDGIFNTNAPNVDVGTPLSTVIGIVAYNFGNYEVLMTQAVTAGAATITPEVTALTGSANQLTVGTYNVENLDPGDGAAVFANHASRIVNNLQAPDIVLLQEMQDNNGPTNDSVVDASVTIQTLINAIVTAGGPTYQYRQIDPVDDTNGGEPGGNIRVVFLFNPLRVTFVDTPGGTATSAASVTCTAGVPSLNFSPALIDPTNAAFSASRKPLIGTFLFNGNTVFIINNHWNSKGGDTPLFGTSQPPVLSSETQRVQQAAVVAGFINSLTACNPNAYVIVGGDLNDFQWSNPLAQLIGAGGGMTVMNLGIANERERYGYVFDGNSQTLDQIVVTNNLINAPVNGEYDAVHINSEFFTQTSDHDPSVARFTLAAPVTASVEVTTAPPATVSEANLTASFTVTLTTSAPLVAPLTVTFTPDGTVANSATGGGVDYSLPAAPQVTFPLGATTGSTQSFSVTIVEDSALERDEAVKLDVSASGGTVTGATSFTFAIEDNEQAVIGFVAASSTTADEEEVIGYAIQLAVVDQSASPGTWALPVGDVIMVDVADAGTGTATQGAGQDYLHAAAAAVTFSAAGTQQDTTDVRDDALFEGPETVNLLLQNVVAPTGVNAAVDASADAHVVTITDDETVSIGFTSPTSATANESAAVSPTVTLTITDTTAALNDGALAVAINAAVTSTAGGTASVGVDFAAVNTPIAFVSGALSGATQSVTVTPTDDSLFEGSETVVLSLGTITTTPVGLTVGTGTASHTTTITDDETASIGFSPATGTIAENAGVGFDAAAVLTLTGTTVTPPTTAIAVGATAVDAATGTATVTSDYTVLSPNAFIFPIGSASGAVINTTITPVDDVALEGNETVDLTLNAPTGGATLGTTGLTLTLTDDDGATVAFALPTTITVDEAAQTVTIGVALTIPGGGTLTSPITVDVVLSGTTGTDGLDFAFSPVTLTFASGAETQNITLDVLPDLLVEGSETVTLALQNLTAGAALVTLGTQTSHVVTLTDDDGAAVTFASAATSAAEDTAGTLTIPVVLSIPGGGTLVNPVSFDVIDAGTGTATAGTDFTFSPATLTFPAGSANGATQTVTLAVTADTDVEPDETVVLSLINLNAGGGVVAFGALTTHTVTLVNDDIPPVGAISVTFETTGYSGPEDSLGTITIPVTLTLNGIPATTEDIVVSVSDAGTGTAAPSTDYTFGPVNLTFPAGSVNGASQIVSLTITPDTTVEPDETVVLGLSVLSGPAVPGLNAQNITIIGNDDSPGGIPVQPVFVPTPVPALVFVCDNLIAQTNGDMIGSGAIGNVRLNNSVGNTYCRLLAQSNRFITPPEEIGLQSILNLGVTHAVNLFGLIENGTPVFPFTSPVFMCLRGTGDVLFVNASDTARIPVRLAATPGAGGYSCVSVPASGLVVMVNGSSGLAASGRGPTSATASGTPQQDVPLTGFCQVTTTAQVRLRSTPDTSSDANILTVVPFDVTLTATAYNPAGFYFLVYSQWSGYVSEQYLDTVGACQ